MNLLSLAGDVALQQLIHLEQAVSGELCRRRVLREEQEQKTKGPKEKVNGAAVHLGLCHKHFPDLLHDLGSLTFPCGNLCFSTVKCGRHARSLLLELWESSGRTQMEHLLVITQEGRF